MGGQSINQSINRVARVARVGRVARVRRVASVAAPWYGTLGRTDALVGAPVDRSGLTVLNFFVQKLVSIRVVYPSATHPLEPRINQNLRTDRPEVLTKYGLWGSSIKYGYEAF